MAAPKLRFKEFDGDWISKKIIDLADYVDYRGKTPKKVESGILLVTAKNIKQGYLDYSASQEFIEESAFDDVMRRGKVELNDVLITTEAPLGNVASVDRTDIALAQRVIKYRGKIDLLDNLFLKQKFLSESFQEILKSKATGGTVQGIKGSVLHQIPLIVPSKEEQTKIASFLSAVDEKISQLTQKHELLSQYKQGMMQKLFSQQIRFKADDGSEFGEWETHQIQKVFTNKSKNYDPQNVENLPCIELEHLSQNTGEILGTISSLEQKSTKNFFEPNSVLFGKLRPYLRKFAKPQFKGVCSSEIWVLNGLKISNDYLFQYIQSEQFTELTNIQSGSKMPRADWNIIANSEIEYPSSEEQTKIASFLSAIDQKIEVVAQQIQHAKLWKKGLLQQMFV
ncbi:restriction endonuclease subunit S [Acinetobacter sp. A3.8]|uniref:Restriction endonuclease subunit S n=1 Tax=Acinetobacter sedimenti TaxID=2919922 RepID=A0A9X1WZH5_9GAMM|nr:restriction endonuclease subunit S [Acinetobacter sedimenti]MCJ8147453.1 restriction endonuclease subunit S [Acinetobacter sedimenti]